MAAIDPSEEPDFDAAEEKTKPRATLKLVRVPEEMLDDSEDDDEDFEDIDDEDEDSDAEEVNGGPSLKKSTSKKALKAEDDDDEDEDMEDDSADEAAAEAVLAKLMKAEKKGKSKALDGEDEEDDENDDSEESMGIDECVICTLDPEKVCFGAIPYPQLFTNHLRRAINNLLTSTLPRARTSSSRSLAASLST